MLSTTQSCGGGQREGRERRDTLKDEREGEREGERERERERDR